MKRLPKTANGMIVIKHKIVIKLAEVACMHSVSYTHLYTMFPANFDRYIEVFGGGGWVLFGKPPDDRCMEVYNDYNSNLANLFYCVKNRTGALDVYKRQR